MTNQNQPGQQNQAPGQKPGQQQGAVRNPANKARSPAVVTKIPNSLTSKPAIPIRN
ncbi:hypothetical protein [Bradyrhizobium sp.]|uniref:hypothetical protein n=1 Tax=Bradyrhizobium sp. TaxID=376 RepID=UPI0025C26992|nr:hypothetical protein [Bradyrhizobium sp.]